MSTNAESAANDMFRDIGDIVGELETKAEDVAAQPAVESGDAAGSNQFVEDDEDSDAELEQGEPEAFVMNQVCMCCACVFGCSAVGRPRFPGLFAGFVVTLRCWACAHGLCASISPQVMGMDSYCMSCGDNGKTNLLMTRIPFFRNVIIMAFHCRHCGFRSSEVQSAEIQDKGTKFELEVATAKVRGTAPRVACMRALA